MTEKEAIEVIETEKQCVLRNSENWCDRDCICCDLVMAESEIICGYDTAIKAIEEIQQYRAIGTVEECREVRERQRAEKPILQTPNHPDEMLEHHCPECGEFVCHALNIVHSKANKTNYCMVCGQKLDWSDTD